MIFLNRLILISCGLCIWVSVKGQSSPAKVQPYSTRKNIISAFCSVNNFFDETRAIQAPLTNIFSRYGNVSNVSFGFEFGQRVSNRHSLGFALNYFRTREYDYGGLPRPCTTREMRMNERRWLILEASDNFLLLRLRRFELYSTLGLVFRVGYELTFDKCGNGFEGDMNNLSDLGIKAGIKPVIQLPSSFLILGELAFYEFLFRPNHGPVGAYSNFAKHGSTPHMLSARLGVGFQF